MTARRSSPTSEQTRPSPSGTGPVRGNSRPCLVTAIIALILSLSVPPAFPGEKTESPPPAGKNAEKPSKDTPDPKRKLKLKPGGPGVTLKNFRLQAFDSMIEFTRGTEGERSAIYVLMGNVELAGEAASDPPGKITINCENAILWVDWGGKEENKTPVREFYADGHVRLAQSGMVFCGNAMYFDFRTGDGIVLDARVQTTQAQERILRRSALAEMGVIRGEMSALTMDIFIRAETIRVKGWRAFSGKKIVLSPVGFAEPPWGLESEDFTFHSDQTISARGNWFRVGPLKVPIFPLEIERDWRPPLKKLYYRSSRYYGNLIRTTWELYSKRWRVSPTKDSPPRSGHAAVFIDVDYYRKRGNGWGAGFLLESKYRQPKPGDKTKKPLGLPPPKRQYYAFMHGYYIKDDGLEDAKYLFPHENRGRLKFVGRYRFSNTALVDAEVSKLSDEYVLLDYFEDEYKEAKEQETYISFTKTWADTGMELFSKKRINTFMSKTEYLPAVRGHVLSSRLGAGFSASGRAEGVNYAIRPVAGFGNETHELARGDFFAELSRPVAAKRYFHLHPTVFGRLTAYETGRLREQPVNRTVIGAECRITSELSRVFKVESKTLDIYKLRHIVNPEIAYRYTCYNNVDPGDLFSIAKIDTIDGEQPGDFILRNRLQTKRTRVEHGKRTTNIVNLLDLELEVRYFPQEKRDNGGMRFGLGEAELLFTPTPSLILEVNAEYSGHNAHRFESCDVGLTYKRPTWSIYYGNRYTRGHTANMIGALTFEVGEKWAFEFTHEADAYNNVMHRKEFTMIRNFYGWKLELSYEVDYDDKDRAVSVRLLPPGFKQVRKPFRRRYDRLE